MRKREAEQARYMRWLRLVWDALSSDDPEQRDSRLRAARALLRSHPADKMEQKGTDRVVQQTYRPGRSSLKGNAAINGDGGRLF